MTREQEPRGFPGEQLCRAREGGAGAAQGSSPGGEAGVPGRVCEQQSYSQASMRGSRDPGPGEQGCRNPRVVTATSGCVRSRELRGILLNDCFPNSLSEGEAQSPRADLQAPRPSEGVGHRPARGWPRCRRDEGGGSSISVPGVCGCMGGSPGAHWEYWGFRRPLGRPEAWPVWVELWNRPAQT